LNASSRESALLTRRSSASIGQMSQPCQARGTAVVRIGLLHHALEC
jgi:hypothetical protein